MNEEKRMKINKVMAAAGAWHMVSLHVQDEEEKKVYENRRDDLLKTIEPDLMALGADTVEKYLIMGEI